LANGLSPSGAVEATKIQNLGVKLIEYALRQQIDFAARLSYEFDAEPDTINWGFSSIGDDAGWKPMSQGQ
jgi:hypothetical protein